MCASGESRSQEQRRYRCVLCGVMKNKW